MTMYNVELQNHSLLLIMIDISCKHVLPILSVLVAQLVKRPRANLRVCKEGPSEFETS